MDLQPFLTAYDPSDLPGGSLDPLGFDRGYQTLADKILPGLTNVANRPRYISVLCAALLLASDACNGATPTARAQARLDAVLRLERFWTLGCGLASKGDAKLDTSGIRGIRYVEAEVQRMDRQASTKGDFRLLSRQQQYGLLGIYGSVSEGFQLFERPDFELHDAGRRLGESFIEETQMPSRIKDVVVAPGAVPVDALREWGARAHVGGKYAMKEAAILSEIAERDETRRRMTAHLRAVPALTDEGELGRLDRIASRLETLSEDRDLLEAVRAIAMYEELFRTALLVFQRVLGRCQQEEPFEVELSSLDEDAPTSNALERLKRLAARAPSVFEDPKTPLFRLRLERLGDALEFLHAAATAKNGAELAVRVIARHHAVQAAKGAGTRPKMPWLEVTGGRVKQTLTFAQRIGGLPEVPEDVGAHPYRTWAADRFFAAEAMSS